MEKDNIDKLLFAIKVANDNIIVINQKIESIMRHLRMEESGRSTEARAE